jgi:uncharacterized protein involved in exopolysaccharide biosynthesis
MSQTNPISVGQVMEWTRRRKHWIWATTLIVSLIAIAVAIRLPKMYRSTSIVLVQPHRFPEQLTRSFDLYKMENRLRILSEIIYSRTFLQPVIDSEGLYSESTGEKNPDEIIEKMRKDTQINVKANDVFSISYEGQDPVKVMNATNRLARQFISLLQEQVSVVPVNPQVQFLDTKLKELYSEMAELQSMYTKDHPELRALKKKIVEVEAVLQAEKKTAPALPSGKSDEALQAEPLMQSSARIIDEATLPLKPVRPNRTLIAVIGSVLGFVLGVGVAILAEMSDHTFRYAGDLQQLLGLPVISIPQVETLREIQRGKIKRRMIWGFGLVFLCMALIYFYQNMSTLKFAGVAKAQFMEKERK